MDQLNKLFRNPPQGGNERGVVTSNPMTTPAAGPQPTVFSNFAAGVESARERIVDGAQTATPELRNFGRGDTEDSRYWTWDRPGDVAYEAEHELARTAQVAAPPKQAPAPERVTSTLSPPAQDYRSDGKPL